MGDHLDSEEEKGGGTVNQALGFKNVWKRAYVAAGRPLVCACKEYEWLHRRGFGLCKVGASSRFDADLQNRINRLTREIALEEGK